MQENILSRQKKGINFWPLEIGNWKHLLSEHLQIIWMVEEMRFKIMQDFSILPLQLDQYRGAGEGFGISKCYIFNRSSPRSYLLMKNKIYFTCYEWKEVL